MYYFLKHVTFGDCSELIKSPFPFQWWCISLWCQRQQLSVYIDTVRWTQGWRPMFDVGFKGSYIGLEMCTVCPERPINPLMDLSLCFICLVLWWMSSFSYFLFCNVYCLFSGHVTHLQEINQTLLVTYWWLIFRFCI